MPEAKRAHIAIRGVSKRFAVGDGEVEALGRIDATIAQGELVCLIGASGCGKSTMLRIIAGFEEPSTGEVLVDGERITAPGSDRGMVFQDYALFPWMTVRQNIGFGPRQRRLPRREVDEIANEFVKLVGLERSANRYPNQLSGGMKQRVTVVFVTHSVEEAALLGDRVLVMSAGPGRIEADIAITLARPRDVSSPEFNAVRRELARRLTSHMAPRRDFAAADVA